MLISLVGDFSSQPLDPKVVGQYVCRLEEILQYRALHGAKDLRDLLVQCLQNKDPSFVNHACEIGAADYFRKRYPENFALAVPSHQNSGDGPHKDFDFTFKSDEITFNVEVKTITPKVKPDEDDGAPRNQSYLTKEQNKLLMDFNIDLSDNGMPRLARALKKANGQLARPTSGITVMLYCCNDYDEQIAALTCLIGPNGICNKTVSDHIVPAPIDLPNVDAVVICNLGLLQASVLYPDRYATAHSIKGQTYTERVIDGCAPWDYHHSFPIVVPLGEMSNDFIKPLLSVFQSIGVIIMKKCGLQIDKLQSAYFETINEILNSNYRLQREKPNI